MLLNGEAMREWGEDGGLIHDDPLLVLLNAHHEPIPFKLPACGSHTHWQLLVDTTYPVTDEAQQYTIGEQYELGGRSLALLSAV
jgi:glycogen operon protein